MIPRTVTPGRAGAVLTCAVLTIVGCGADDDTEAMGTPSAPEADLVVEAHDIDFDRDEYTLASGEQQVLYVQKGDMRHTLVVETADGELVDGFSLEVGDSLSDSGTIDLEPGRYTLFCDVPGHREAGMEAVLVVTATTDDIAPAGRRRHPHPSTRALGPTTPEAA